jgi:hypothetical protein
MSSVPAGASASKQRKASWREGIGHKDDRLDHNRSDFRMDVLRRGLGRNAAGWATRPKCASSSDRANSLSRTGPVFHCRAGAHNLFLAVGLLVSACCGRCGALPKANSA